MEITNTKVVDCNNKVLSPLSFGCFFLDFNHNLIIDHMCRKYCQTIWMVEGKVFVMLHLYILCLVSRNKPHIASNVLTYLWNDTCNFWSYHCHFFLAKHCVFFLWLHIGFCFTLGSHYSICVEQTNTK
jgi:hypothetical protein